MVKLLRLNTRYLIVNSLNTELYDLSLNDVFLHVAEQYQQNSFEVISDLIFRYCKRDKRQQPAKIEA